MQYFSPPLTTHRLRLWYQKNAPQPYSSLASLNLSIKKKKKRQGRLYTCVFLQLPLNSIPACGSARGWRPKSRLILDPNAQTLANAPAVYDT
jgi:hypothetical protein